jgi:hypothetical protein
MANNTNTCVRRKAPLWSDAMLRLIQRLRETRLLLWAGVVVFAAGAGLDVAVHALLPATPFPLISPPSPAENMAHLVTFAGMVLLLAGVLTVPRTRRMTAPSSELESERG